MLQPFKTLDDFVRHHHVLLPKPADTWRLVRDPIVGRINALDAIRGGSVATNGVFVALLDELGTVRFGHLQWFEPDADETNVELSDLWGDMVAARPTKPKVIKALADYTSW